MSLASRIVKLIKESSETDINYVREDMTDEEEEIINSFLLEKFTCGDCRRIQNPEDDVLHKGKFTDGTNYRCEECMSFCNECKEIWHEDCLEYNGDHSKCNGNTSDSDENQ